MSRRNLELYRQSVDAFNRRDLEAFLALMDVDVEAVSRLVAIEGGYRGHDGIRRWWGNLLEAIPDFTYHGHEGLRRWWREWREAWEDYEDAYEDLIDAGEHVISVTVSRGRGRTSGADIGYRQHGVWTIKGAQGHPSGVARDA